MHFVLPPVCPPPLHKTWHSSLQIKPFHWIACGSSNVLLWTIIRCCQLVFLRRCAHIWAAFSVPVQVLQCLREPIKKPSAFFSVCHRPSIEKTASRGEKESAEQPKGSKQFKLQHLQLSKTAQIWTLGSKGADLQNYADLDFTANIYNPWIWNCSLEIYASRWNVEGAGPNSMRL